MAEVASDPLAPKSESPLWLAAIAFGLMAAFWPVVSDLVRHVVVHPWARGAIVFPLLVWIAVRAEGANTGPERRWVLRLALPIALAIELVAVAGDVVRLGRVALVLAVAASLFGTGRAGLLTLSLTIWLIPLPSAIAEILSPSLESTWAQIPASPILGVSFAAGPDGLMLSTEEGGHVVLVPADGGLASAYALAGLAWFQGLMRRLPMHRLMWRSAIAALFSHPIHLGVIGLATIVLSLSPMSLVPQRLLDHGPWLIVVLAGLVLAVRERVPSTAGETS